MTFHQHILPNGLQLVGEISPSAKSVAFGFFLSALVPFLALNLLLFFPVNREVVRIGAGIALCGAGGWMLAMWALEAAAQPLWSIILIGMDLLVIYALLAPEKL